MGIFSWVTNTFNQIISEITSSIEQVKNIFGDVTDAVSAIIQMIETALQQLEQLLSGHDLLDICSTPLEAMFNDMATFLSAGIKIALSSSFAILTDEIDIEKQIVSDVLTDVLQVAQSTIEILVNTVNLVIEDLGIVVNPSMTLAQRFLEKIDNLIVDKLNYFYTLCNSTISNFGAKLTTEYFKLQTTINDTVTEAMRDIKIVVSRTEQVFHSLDRDIQNVCKTITVDLKKFSNASIVPSISTALQTGIDNKVTEIKNGMASDFKRMEAIINSCNIHRRVEDYIASEKAKISKTGDVILMGFGGICVIGIVLVLAKISKDED